MKLSDKLYLLYRIAKWRLTWNMRDLGYRPPNCPSSRFMNARQAVQLINDGDTVISCGMAGNARCSIFYWALREAFEKGQHPRDLTWIAVGAQGSRGRAPGTVEELGLDGLLSCFISGHHETAKSLLALGEQGKLEMHTLPQGEMTFILEAQAKGELSVRSTVGLDTFLDPKVGPGSATTPNAKRNLVERDGDELIYSMPKINVAMFNAPYADKDGNIYFHNAATITENIEAAKAARANGGRVLAAVADIIPRDDSRICLSADLIDAIVVNPRNEQTGAVPQRSFWPMFTSDSKEDTAESVEKLKFINNTLKITPVRGPVENALARIASSLFVDAAHPGAIVNIGVGLPEEVCRLMYESGLYHDLTFTSETGVFGGLPTPGIFFGAAINPKELQSSAWMFHLYQEKLSVAVLGLLQVDSEGNVNVSKRGPKVTDYVGPGGFPNIVDGAKTIIFVGSWMAHSKMSLNNGQLSIDKPGKPKFIEKVDQVTFSGKRGLELGKKVFYVTNVGVFQLTERGLELIRVMPGIDVQRDIINGCTAKIVLPENGEVPLVAPELASGKGFRLQWPQGAK